MSQTHYYYVFNRKAAERALDLTWNQFLKKFGWPAKGEWSTLGEFLGRFVDYSLLPDEPTPKQLAPLLPWTLRKTIARSSPQYFVLLSLNDELPRRWRFVKADLEAGSLEAECDAFINCALRALERNDIDDRTCWAVLALNDPSPFESWGYADEYFENVVGEISDALGAKARRSRKTNPAAGANPFALNDTQHRRIATLKHRFGRSKPIFDWQPTRAVCDGHNALAEEDTLRFAAFLKAAWRHNWPVWEDGAGAGQHFRDFELTNLLCSSIRAFRDNCVVHYYGP